jgi:hypothetical protein
MKLFGKMLMPVLIIFVTLTILIFAANTLWVKYNVDRDVLLGANVLFLVTSVIVFFMQKNALNNTNPNVFVRSVIAGMMIKMFSTAIAVLAYVLIVGSTYNTSAVFISLIMYLIYLAAEVMAISKENKNKHA